MKRHALAVAIAACMIVPQANASTRAQKTMEDAAIDRLVRCVALAARGIADQSDPATDLARAAVAMCPGELLALRKLSRSIHGEAVGNHATKLAEEECYRGALATIVASRAAAKHRPKPAADRGSAGKSF